MPTTQMATPAAARRLLFGLCFLAFILMACDDSAFGVLLPTLTHYYGVDKATISLIFVTATAGYLSAALSTGPLISRLGPRRFLMLGIGAFVLGTLVLVALPAFFVVLAAFLLIGFGSGTIDAGLNAYIAGLPNNTAPLNYLHAFYGIGAIIGPLVAATILAAHFGWNIVYAIWTVLGAGVLLGVVRLFPAQDRIAPEPGERNGLLAVLRLPPFWFAAPFLFLYVGTEVSIGNWSYSYLTEARFQPDQWAAGMVSGYWLGLTIGRLVLGTLSARLSNRQVIQLCLGGMAVGGFVIWLAPSGLVLAAGMLLTGFSVGPIYPTIIALLSELVPPRLVPSAVGILSSLSSVGAAFFPWLIGNLAQAVGLWIFMPYTIGITAILLVLWAALTMRRSAPTRERPADSAT
jgi:fucose permease